jgi:hypothetical protein
MARARSKQGTNTKSDSSKSSEFICPECGRTFTRAAALGAHRRRAHGVPGASSAARRARASGSRSRRRGRAAAAGNGGSTSSGRLTRRRTTTSSRPRSASGAQTDGINRDLLLRALFPQGIPPREEVVSAVNDWLNEAARLAALK